MIKPAQLVQWGRITRADTKAGAVNAGLRVQWQSDGSPSHPPPRFFLMVSEKAKLAVSGTSRGDHRLAQVMVLHGTALWSSLLMCETEVRLPGSWVRESCSPSTGFPSGASWSLPLKTHEAIGHMEKDIFSKNLKIQ